ncbi:hypothetical protein [Mucilaginibacter psychrotolerans]|uniref:HEAT repeat domain-containing protein n=1 Tax=Mucilaginibacter psychrotolerans TaxID=1524096 RepID=A0A4Y8SDT6_9SPHI|nr:hypothetical protein [Mucilaginibacter psychrotolerans]TFF36841.1 hypothetical protein E2R66_13815 [Mucilaginibacter psychrotolerans]
MKAKFSSIVKALYERRINEADFLKQYFDGKAPSANYLKHLIEKAIAYKDADLVEESILLLDLLSFYNDSFLLLLCRLLKENWHMKHEDIAMLLKEIKSPQTIDYLYDATEMQFDYLDYDDTYQFAKKCIKALSAIGNEKAIDKLRLLAASRNLEIAKYAQKELRYLDKL